MYVNVGARYNVDKTEIPTKAALKRAIKENPASVLFEGTSEFHPFYGTTDKLDEHAKYSVTGPNPYTNRKWYATVEKTAKGIKVS
jgi:hypothetical protein